MNEQDRALARNIEHFISKGGREARRGRALAADCTLQVLVTDLVAARAAAGMTQQDVADRMPSTKSVVSRLESGVHTRPTLTTIEKYARAVGAIVEIRVRTRR
jgi:ribosome-binding protein aMBF1 (putative translation factor)